MTPLSQPIGPSKKVQIQKNCLVQINCETVSKKSFNQIVQKQVVIIDLDQTIF